MKKKTIEKVINKKFNEWLNTITDSDVREEVRKHSIITGGCIASMLLQEPVNDFDVYFDNPTTVLMVTKYYVQRFGLKDSVVVYGQRAEEQNPLVEPTRTRIFIKSAGVAREANPQEEDQEEEPDVDMITAHPEQPKEPYRPVFLSMNAITLANKIQIVIRFYGDPENIHQHYDYLHCTNYWLSKDRSLHLNQPALEALLSKELIYVGSKYPIASIVRLRKFIKRGWSVNAGQVLKISYQISKLNLDDYNVLEDQLTGVDAAYFTMLIEALKSHSEKQPGFKLDYSYLATIIDKIF